jgi:hypothetical protein
MWPLQCRAFWCHWIRLQRRTCERKRLQQLRTWNRSAPRTKLQVRDVLVRMQPRMQRTYKNILFFFTYTHAHMHTLTHSLTHSHSLNHSLTHIHSHIHTHTYTHTHTHTHTHTQHTHTHARLHTHTHTHTHSNKAHHSNCALHSSCAGEANWSCHFSLITYSHTNYTAACGGEGHQSIPGEEEGATPCTLHPARPWQGMTLRGRNPETQAQRVKEAAQISVVRSNVLLGPK